MMSLLAHLPITDLSLAMVLFVLGGATGFAIARLMSVKSK